MGSLRLTVCSALLAVAAFSPAAHAADGGSLSVAPAAPAPGSDVTLRVSGCTGKQGTASSRAFVSEARLTGGQGALAGETRVSSSLQPGAYDVTVTCADCVVNGMITIVDRPSAGSASQGSGLPVRPGQASAVPVAPVDAGTARFATVATSGSGPGTAQAVTGLALASVAAVAVGLRARRNRRPR